MPLIKDVKVPNTPKQARVQTAVWVLIYSGLLILLTGITLGTMTVGGEGWQTSHSLMLGGGVLTALGAVLIYVRSRME
jgi:hypothetical protein